MYQCQISEILIVVNDLKSVFIESIKSLKILNVLLVLRISFYSFIGYHPALKGTFLRFILQKWSNLVMGEVLGSLL